MTPTLTPAALGFTPTASGWQKAIQGQLITFRMLTEWDDLGAVERLQREIFGISDHDLTAASLLIVIPKTGGQILGAYAPGTNTLIGFATSYGGYVASAPRLLSDMLAVQPAFRGGLGFALKSLQAAIALDAGFREITWTVDPLRAANARLNFERLGATAHEYRENFYGTDFATGLYGGLPSDRLVVHWPIASPQVAARLLGKLQPRAPGSLDALPLFTAGDQPLARAPIPTDIDALVAHDLPAAQQWRLALRATLSTAFANGYTITGFASSRQFPDCQLLLERTTAGRA